MASLKCKEILCVTYSFVLFILAIFMIGFSVVLSYKAFYHYKFIPSATVAPIFLLMLFGVIHLFSTWFGIRGPSKRHDCAIFFFIFLTALLLFFEFVVAIWSTKLLFNVSSESLTLMNSSFNSLLKNDLDKSDWNRLQKKLKCCGVNGVNDYMDKLTIPIACCKNEDMVSSTCRSVNEKGCAEPLEKYAKKIMKDVLWLGYSCGSFQILGLIVFAIFVKGIRDKRAKRVNEYATRQRHQQQQSPQQEQTESNNVRT